MKRILFGILMMVLVSVFAVSGAEAKRSKKRSAKSKQKEAVSANISTALGNLRWGMTEEAVTEVLIKNTRNRYRPLIAKANDAVEDDRLRIKERQEIKSIRDSRVKFDGQSTGWDLGFLRDEFTHNNGESMLVVKDSNSQNFYFFIQGKLWKWYKALDIKVFAGKDFKKFSDVLQHKFGKATSQKGELTPGGGERTWLEWSDKKTRLRAIDQTSFYGFYCLVFEEKNTLSRLASLRSSPSSRRRPQKHTLVEAVTADSDISANPDSSPNIVDRITGKIRQKEEMAEEKDKGKRKNKRSKSKSSPSLSESDNDPLKGLDL